MEIFVIDDERILRKTLTDELRDAGHQVKEFSNARVALLELRESKVDLIFTDIRMPEMDGIQFLKQAMELKTNAKIVMITAHASVETAVKALKMGAYDYIEKPYNLDEILVIIDRIKELKELIKDNELIVSELSKTNDFSSFVGESKEIVDLFEQVKAVADTDTNILITGETGTGKELLSSIIHYNSPRKNKAFIRVSCAILSRDIFESELFGHEKGAFTGADQQKIGRFEMANGGTIYLDDVDDIPLDLQVKLLRVLQEKEIERVGGGTPISINVRVITSTKYNLMDLVKEGKFREDLYYRLHVFPLTIPPLRERPGDIKRLAKYFAVSISKKQDFNITEEALEILASYDFPGNTRELKNLMERMVVLSRNNIITTKEIPIEVKSPDDSRICSRIGEISLNEMVAQFEMSAIKLSLEKSNNNKAQAAQLLKIPDSTLRTKIEKYKLD